MSKDKSVSYSGGIGFTGLLTIVFVTLKLTGRINWSWWWVLLPSWGPIAIALGTVIVVFLLVGVMWALAQATLYFSKRKDSKRSRREQANS